MLLSAEALADANEGFSGLLGLPLTGMWRYLSYQRFEFGEQNPAKNHEGEDVMRAEWALTAICEWRIEGPEGFVLTDEHSVPFDERLQTDPPIVQSAEAFPDGSVRIRMTRGLALFLNPLPEDWDVMDDSRLMPPIGDRRGHLVLDRGRLGWSG